MKNFEALKIKAVLTTVHEAGGISGEALEELISCDVLNQHNHGNLKLKRDFDPNAVLVANSHERNIHRAQGVTS